MDYFHLEAKIVSRGSGRSVIAAAAYASCSRLYNDYDGLTHDYTRKRGCLYSEVFLPDNALPEWKDRQTLWEAVELAEKTKDSRLARELVMALPVELSLTDWKVMLERFISEQGTGLGMCADVNIHDTDGHNPPIATSYLRYAPWTSIGNGRPRRRKNTSAAGERKNRDLQPMSSKSQDTGLEEAISVSIRGETEVFNPIRSGENRRMCQGIQDTEKHPLWASKSHCRPLEQRGTTADMAQKLGSHCQ